MTTDAKEIWNELNNRLRLSYYIGVKKTLILHNHVMGASPGPIVAPDTLGVDGDGEVDATYVKESDE